MGVLWTPQASLNHDVASAVSAVVSMDEAAAAAPSLPGMTGHFAGPYSRMYAVCQSAARGEERRWAGERDKVCRGKGLPQQETDLHRYR